MDNRKPNIILEKSFDFAVRIIKLYKYLKENKKEYVLSKQILKCGTSIGANIEEAHGGISTADFSNKISIAYKESRETMYWLRLLHAANYINKSMFESLAKDTEELSKLSYAILKSTRISKQNEKNKS